MKYNDAELGTDGATVTTSDTGYPAWDVAVVGATGTNTYSSTGGCIRGSRCYSFSQGVTGAASYNGWNVNSGGSNATQYIRFYVDPADCSGTVILARGMTSSSGSQNWRMTIGSGTLVIRDSSNSTVLTAGTTMSDGTRYRVEFYFDGGTSAAYQLLFYVGESTTATYDSGSSTANFGTCQHVRFGIGSSQTSVSGKLDDPAYNDTGPIGPVIQTLTPSSIESSQASGNSTTLSVLTTTTGGSIKTGVSFGVVSVAGPAEQDLTINSIPDVSGTGTSQFAQLGIYAIGIPPEKVGNPIVIQNAVMGRRPSITRSSVNIADPGLGRRLPRKRRASTIPVFGVNYTANAEGGTNGATISTSDTGSGTAFDQSNTGSGATATYSDTINIHGTLGYLFTTSASAVTTYRGWSTSGAEWQWYRIYLNSANQINGSSNIPMSRGSDATNAQCWRLTYNTDKTLNLRNGANTSIITTPPLTDGSPVRCEWMVQGNTNGVARLQLYNLDERESYFDSGEVNDNFVGGVYVVRFGISNAIANLTCALDDLGWSDITWLGPIQATPTAIGIQSKEKFGKPTISNALYGNSIESTSSVGNINIANTQSITPTGMFSTIAFGEHLASTIITPKGFINDPIGNSKFYYQVSSNSISSENVFGDSSLTTTYSVSFAAIKSLVEFGATSSAPASSISPNGIYSTELVPPPVVTSSITVSAEGINEVEIFGDTSFSKLLTPGAINSQETLGGVALVKGLIAQGISDNNYLGNITVSSNIGIIAFGFSTDSVFGNPTNSLSYSINPNGVSTESSVSSVLSGQNVIPLGITGEESFGNIATSIITLINSVSAFDTVSPATVASSYGIAPASIAPVESLGAPFLSTTRGVTAGGISSLTDFGSIEVSQALIISSTTITEAVGPALTVQKISSSGIPDVSITSPTEVTNYKTLYPNGIPCSGEFGNINVALSVTLTPKGVASKAALGDTKGASTVITSAGITGKESVGNSYLTITINPNGVDSFEQNGNITVTTGEVTVTAQGIASTEHVSELESIIPGNTIIPYGVLSSASVGQKINAHYQANVNVGYSIDGFSYGPTRDTTSYDLEDDLNIVIRTTE